MSIVKHILGLSKLNPSGLETHVAGIKSEFEIITIRDLAYMV